MYVCVYESAGYLKIYFPVVCILSLYVDQELTAVPTFLSVFWPIHSFSCSHTVKILLPD